MASSSDVLLPQRRYSMDLSQQYFSVSELNIVLMGRNGPEISRVGNSILGRSAFDTEAPPHAIQSPVVHCETARGRVEGRYITIITSPHLFDQTLSHHHLTLHIKECVTLADPGPHAIILVVNPDHFSEKDNTRLEKIFSSLSDESYKYTLVITTNEMETGTSVDPEDESFLHKIISKCNNRHLVFSRSIQSDLVEMVEQMAKSNEGHLRCDLFEDTVTPPTHQKPERQDHGQTTKSKVYSQASQMKYEEAMDSEKRESKSSKLMQKLKTNLRNPVLVSNLRIVLLGMSHSEVSKVINSIVERPVCDLEAPPPSVGQHCGRVEDRNITIINGAHLCNLTKEKVTEGVRKCVSLSHPGPHAFFLVVNRYSFTEDSRIKLRSILNHFSEKAIKYSIVISTDAGSSEGKKTNAFYQLKKDCNNKHQNIQKNKVHQLFQEVDKIVKKDDYLICEHNLETEPYPLNVVLCGSEDHLKASISELILNKSKQIPDPRSMCMVRDGEVDGCQVHLVEMPCLSRSNTQLSEEEVRSETVRCVSLCDPGVHAFIIVTHVGALNDDQKAEIKMIQKIFSSRVNNHVIILFINSGTDKTAAAKFVEQSSETEQLRRMSSDRYVILHTATRVQQIPELMELVKNIAITNPVYSLVMYVEAQRDQVQKEMEYKMEKKIRQLEARQKQPDAEGEASECGSLRVVLIGKTGNGKSATGNTILNKKVFESYAQMSSVTSICQKAVAEVEGKSIAVIDTPGLFDTTLSNDEVIEEIAKCISMSAPGPHAFIIVLTVGRMTQEEMETLNMIKKMFGPEAAKYSIVLFTRGDDLEDETLEDYINKSHHTKINKLIRDCGGRVHMFNNKEKEDHTQVHELISLIEDMIKHDRNNYFTSEMFEMAEMSIQQRLQELLKEKEEQMEAEKEAIRATYELEMEQMKSKMDKEREEVEKERRKTEEMFKEKEERLKRDYEKKEEEEKEKRRIEDLRKEEEEKLKKEQNDLRLKEMRKEMENQKAQFEQRLADRQEEDRKRTERERDERIQFEQKQKQAMEEIKLKQQEEIRKRDEQESKRREEQEAEMENWRRKMKEAENDKKEIKEDIKRKLKEREQEWTNKMKEREEEERRTKERHNHELRIQEEKQEKMRTSFDKEREEERRRREKEIEEWKEKEKKEREKREEEYESNKLNMKKEYEEIERIRKEEWERRMREDNERREQEKKHLQKIKEEELKKREKEDQERKEREDRERAEMKTLYKNKEKDMKKKYEDEARTQAEKFNDAKAKLEKQIQDLIEKNKKDYELLRELYDGARKDYELLREQGRLQNTPKSTESWCSIL